MTGPAELPDGEFSRIVDLRQIGPAPMELVATTQECAALARRFDIVRINTLTATVRLEADGGIVNVRGRLVADIVQPCAVSAEDLPVSIDEALTLRFVPLAQQPAFSPDEEVEITGEDCDEIAYEGGHFDLGEAVAQSLALAIDPFLTGPAAGQVRASGLLGEAKTSPFAALAALKQKQ